MTNNVLLFLNLGTEEVILIVFVALLLFGGKKLPELAKGLGKGIREFKDASDSVKREIHKNINQLTAEEELEREELLLDAEKQRLRDYNPSNRTKDSLANEEDVSHDIERETILLDAEKNRMRDYKPSNINKDGLQSEVENSNKTI